VIGRQLRFYKTAEQEISEVAMDFTIKLATYDDLEAADRVERSASRGVYLTDAWHYFSTLKGELVCAYDGEGSAVSPSCLTAPAGWRH
jgi:hypothetical protein